MPGVGIGCAGWSIPREYRDAFAAGASVLERYASVFAVVEINTSFYRPHRPSTYARWAATVPADFRFSVKLPKRITHELALRGAARELDAFLEQSSALGAKLGGYLLQLPPSHRFDARLASTFLRMFRSRTGANLVLEPRHRSWCTPKAFELLVRHGTGLVTADPEVCRLDGSTEAEAVWPYWRMHGSPRMYYSSYSHGQLESLATSVRLQRNAKAPAWVIFDNTAHGFATANALGLQQIMARSAPATR